jgi:hypothetical protein
MQPIFTTGDNIEAFCLLLDRKEVGLPDLDDFVHLCWWRWESFPAAIIIKRGIIISEQSVLDLDLRK